MGSKSSKQKQRREISDPAVARASLAAKRRKQRARGRSLAEEAGAALGHADVASDVADDAPLGCTEHNSSDCRVCFGQENLARASRREEARTRLSSRTAAAAAAARARQRRRRSPRGSRAEVGERGVADDEHILEIADPTERAIRLASARAPHVSLAAEATPGHQRRRRRGRAPPLSRAPAPENGRLGCREHQSTDCRICHPETYEAVVKAERDAAARRAERAATARLQRAAASRRAQRRASRSEQSREQPARGEAILRRNRRRRLPATDDRPVIRCAEHGGTDCRICHPETYFAVLQSEQEASTRRAARAAARRRNPAVTTRRDRRERFARRRTELEVAETRRAEAAQRRRVSVRTEGVAAAAQSAPAPCDIHSSRDCRVCHPERYAEVSDCSDTHLPAHGSRARSSATGTTARMAGGSVASASLLPPASSEDRESESRTRDILSYPSRLRSCTSAAGVLDVLNAACMTVVSTPAGAELESLRRQLIMAARMCHDDDASRWTPEVARAFGEVLLMITDKLKD